MTRQVRKQSAMGSSRELAPSEIQFTDSTEYLLGGLLTLKNGRIDKYQFDEGYCQAARVGNTCQDNFTFRGRGDWYMFHLKYDYTYDSLGRLTSSHYSSSVNGTDGRFDESVSYNSNGSTRSVGFAIRPQ